MYCTLSCIEVPNITTYIQKICYQGKNYNRNMNDSFLEDLELASPDVKTIKSYPVDRHVTTRTATSTPSQLPQSKVENIHAEPIIKESKKMHEQGMKKQQMRVRISDRKEKSVETKLKPIENKVHTDGKEQEIRDDIKAKVKESRVKISEGKAVAKDRGRRSGSYKENTQATDASLKENSRPSDCSKEMCPQMEMPKDKTKAYDSLKKGEFKDIDPVTLVNAVKDIVNVCTKQESTKILRAMQELHLNSQANLIKHLLSQTEDIINEMHPSKDSNRMRKLIEENERLQEDVVILQRRNEELQKKLEEFEYLKQENIALKLKCKELSKQ
ncbi:cingulin-like protein 1 [Ceratina calcarata]|uniref:Cingulin-like protein 1 n=1 Tax=Ceratina calcarata TaxID=156304 RepID=A0AAJ7NDR6_9HYME|nr:cingulin-like protein 1 [Ceratina calcarata]